MSKVEARWRDENEQGQELCPDCKKILWDSDMMHPLLLPYTSRTTYCKHCRKILRVEIINVEKEGDDGLQS